LNNEEYEVTGTLDPSLHACINVWWAGAHPFCEKKALLLKKKSPFLFSAPMIANAWTHWTCIASNSLNKNDVLVYLEAGINNTMAEKDESASTMLKKKTTLR